MPVGPNWFSWWILPVVSSLVWTGTILAMLIVWLADGSPHYYEMDPGENIAYISDVGAHGLKPLFIAGSTITAITFCLSLMGERWLRHSGRIIPNTRSIEKVLSVFAVIGAITGSAGLILLSIFDTAKHSRLHRIFLAVFAAGILASALGTLLEYALLKEAHRTNRTIRNSMWIKGLFFVVEFALAIAFGVTMNKGIDNPAAVLEWVLAVVFVGYLISFILDFYGATKTHRGELSTMALDEEKVDFAAQRRRGKGANFKRVFSRR